MISGKTIEYWGIVASATAAFILLGVRLNMRTVTKKIWDSTLGRRSLQYREVKSQLGLVIEGMADIQQKVSSNGGGAIPDSLQRIENRQHLQIAQSNATRYAAKEATFSTDLMGLYVETNLAHSRLTGFNHGEMLGDGWVNLVAPSARKVAQEKWNKAVSEKREFSEDILYTRPSGREYMVHVTAFKQLDDEGTLHGYHGVVTLLEEVA